MTYKPILFCDFDGTLCHDLYWQSLPKEQQRKIQELLFGDDKTLIHKWMLGKCTAEEINTIVAHHLEMSTEDLWEIFVRDCETMRIPASTLKK